MLNPESVDFYIEPLEKKHNRGAFGCGNEQLDQYLHSIAIQDKKRNIAIPYAILDRERQQIIGYYTLSMSGISLENLPQNIAKKLPRYPMVGVTLIGRLAVDESYKGLGWGKLLLLDALHRSLSVSQKTASFAVVVDAIDEAAVQFYQRFEFQAFPNRPDKLFRMMSNIALSFGSPVGE
ncbi:MAG: GNAT family N-acetyltransferase [Acaryochloridaceae cyanobacterium RU_4_10]|nr:GNAT family N-acetyltransferase [Acaryochloridaceae cyanobacterium RU_4_10]